MPCTLPPCFFSHCRIFTAFTVLMASYPCYAVVVLTRIQGLKQQWAESPCASCLNTSRVSPCQCPHQSNVCGSWTCIVTSELWRTGSCLIVWASLGHPTLSLQRASEGCRCAPQHSAIVVSVPRSITVYFRAPSWCCEEFYERIHVYCDSSTQSLSLKLLLFLLCLSCLSTFFVVYVYHHNRYFVPFTQKIVQDRNFFPFMLLFRPTVSCIWGWLGTSDRFASASQVLTGTLLCAVLGDSDSGLNCVIVPGIRLSHRQT